MKNNLDELLKRVLTPREEAGEFLNRKILIQVKESEKMRQKKYKKASAAVLAAALTAMLSATAVAAWQYKSAGDVAGSMGDEKLEQSFREQFLAQEKQDDSAGVVGESQSFGGYKVTVLGFMSGQELTDMYRWSNGELHSDRTYCAVAIEREDGAAMQPQQDDFFVSPLIGGLNPSFYNAATFKGSYGEFVEDGVLYRLLDCDNITYFADHELYLCVSDTAFFDNRLYHYDEETGSISRNTEYQGLNALFELELDASLADPEKAQALIDEADRGSEGEGGELELPKESQDALDWAEQLTPDTLGQYCVRRENTVQNLKIDEEGFVHPQPWLVNEAVSDTRGGGGGDQMLSFIFGDDLSPRTVITGYNCSDGMEDLVITTMTLNGDGTVTFAAWVPRDISIYLE